MRRRPCEVAPVRSNVFHLCAIKSAVPTGTRRNFTSYPALRLRLRAGLNSFAPDGAGFSLRTRYWQIPHLSCIQILTSQAQSVPPCWLLLCPVGIHQDLAGLAGFQQFHAAREILHCYAIGNDGMQVELVGLEQRGHLVPGLVHAAAVDALHGRAFEDDFFREVKFDWLGGNSEEGHAAAETQYLESGSDGFGSPGHLQHDVDAGAIGVVHHDLVDIVLGGIEDEVGLHLLGDLAAMFVDFERVNLCGSAGARHGDGEQPDRAATGDGYALGRDVARQHGVHRVAQRVEDRRVLFRNRGIEFPDIRLGNDHVLGEGAVGVDADDLHMLADVRLADAALQALAARHVHFGGDEVARLDAGDFVAHGFDRAAELVAGNQRWMNAALRPLVPLVNVEVGAADGRHLDLDQYVGQAELRLGNFADFYARRRRGLNDGKHGIRHEDGSWMRFPPSPQLRRTRTGIRVTSAQSEEHTSELQ